MKTTELLTSLRNEIASQNKLLQNELMPAAIQNLQQRSSIDKWNALECVEHLNGYARHYLKAFENALEKSITKEWVSQPEVKSTWLGRKCIQTVLVTTTKKIKTPKRHNHLNKQLTLNVLEEFKNHQKKILLVLEKAEKTNLNKTKVAIEIMPLLKLNLGEFLAFFVFHQTRHLTQAVAASGNK